jgi:hypothetical protein
MFPGAKIVAIDDNEDELKKIVSSLRKLSLACVSYNYPDEKPEDGEGFSGIRLVFLDINLLGGSSPKDDAATYNAPISLLQRIIGESNGPYALVTWSSSKDLHDGLVSRLEKTSSMQGKLPFYTTHLSKGDYLDDPGALIARVREMFSGNPAFAALLDWEHRVSAAGEEVLNVIQVLSAQFGTNAPAEQMDKLLSRLSVDAFGLKHATDHRFEAANEVLMPLLADTLTTKFFAEEGKEIWDAALTQQGAHYPLTPAATAQLNTSFIFEQRRGVKPYRRGALIALPKNMSDQEFEELFGATRKAVRGNLLKLDKPKDVFWVLVQFQAACDFAQDSVGPLPFVLGAVVPHDCIRKSKGGIPLKLPNSVWVSPDIVSNNRICDVLFHFEIIHTLTVSITKSVLDKGKYQPIGRFKDQITSAIAHEHHAHGSRPGFVSIR